MSDFVITPELVAIGNHVDLDIKNQNYCDSINSDDNRAAHRAVTVACARQANAIKLEML